MPGTGQANDPRPSAASLPIRGRAQHLALIDELVANLRRGQGSMLLIEGPPGIGKSRLVDEVGARAARAGARVLSGKSLEDHQTVPFASLFEAVLGVDPHPPAGLQVDQRVGLAAANLDRKDAHVEQRRDRHARQERGEFVRAVADQRGAQTAVLDGPQDALRVGAQRGVGL